MYAFNKRMRDLQLHTNDISIIWNMLNIDHNASIKGSSQHDIHWYNKTTNIP